MSRYSYKRFGRRQDVLPPMAPHFGFMGRSSQAASAAASIPDSDEAASGGHGGGYAITAYDDECCPEVIDITSLLASLGIVAGGALALGGLFQNIFGGGGKRRSLGPLETGLESLGIEYVNAIELFFHSGGEDRAMIASQVQLHYFSRKEHFTACIYETTTALAVRSFVWNYEIRDNNYLRDAFVNG